MYDIKHILHSNGAYVTSSDYGKDENGDYIVLDLCDGKQCKWQGRFIVRADFVNYDPHTPNQCFDLYLQGGSDAAFTLTATLAHIEIGPAACNVSNQQFGVGFYEMLCQNVYKGVIYPYVRVYAVLAGTSPRIIYRANLGKLY